MKAAYLTSEYPHKKTGTSGGIGTSIRNIATALCERGIEVTVLVYEQDCDTFFKDGAINVYRIKNKKVPKLSWWFTRKKIENLINRLCSEGKIDFIEAPDWKGITAFMKLDCPLIIKLNGSDTYFCHIEKRLSKFSNRYLEKKALEQADYLISVSNYTAKITKEIFNLNRKIEIIPNCISVPNIEFKKQADENTILYFGTLIRKKGMLELPYIFNELIKLLPTAKLQLVGNDSYDIRTGSHSTWKLMQPLFSKSALQNVEYIGGVNHEQINSYIQKATVCVFPTFAEALPVSWLEAMAMNKPIVASDVGWASEIIDDGIDGFLVHPTNHKKFAERMVEVVENEALQKQFGKSAKEKVRDKFEDVKVVEKSLNFYGSILKP